MMLPIKTITSDLKVFILLLLIMYILYTLSVVISITGNIFFSYLAILASCFKIVLAKLELHLPLIAAKSDPDSKITIF
jgi:hypothetical protein